MATTRPLAIDEESPLSLGALDGLSLAEFLALPEANPALEYAEGKVINAGTVSLNRGH